MSESQEAQNQEKKKRAGINYQNSIIYTLKNPKMPDTVYVGGTTQPMKRRLDMFYKRLGATPKSEMSYDCLLNGEKVQLEFVKDFPCESKRDLNEEVKAVAKELKAKYELVLT